MDTTLWQIVASGAATTLISNLNSVANRDTRARLLEQGAFEGQLTVQLASALGYTPYRSSVQELMRQIKNADVDPTFEPEIPIPVVSIGVDNIPDYTPVENYTPHLFVWNYKTFEDMGVLDTTAPLAAGVYVVAHKATRSQQFGLPTGFITVSAQGKRMEGDNARTVDGAEVLSMTGWIHLRLPLGGGITGECAPGGAPVVTEHPNGTFEIYCQGKGE